MEIKMNRPKTLFFLLLVVMYVNPVNSGTQIQVTTPESFTSGRINKIDERNYIYFSNTGSVNYLSYDAAVKYEEKAEDYCEEVRDLLRGPAIFLNEQLDKRSGLTSEIVADRSIYNGRIWGDVFPHKCLF